MFDYAVGVQQMHIRRNSCGGGEEWRGGGVEKKQCLPRAGILTRKCNGNSGTSSHHSAVQHQNFQNT